MTHYVNFRKIASAHFIDSGLIGYFFHLEEPVVYKALRYVENSVDNV